MPEPSSTERHSLSESLERRVVTSALDLAVELDRMPVQTVDSIGLLEVVMALSKWRDNLG